jgi:hypothetical protein
VKYTILDNFVEIPTNESSYENKRNSY